MRKIWLVDDDEDDREIFRLALGNISSNISLETAENGIEFLRKLTDSPAIPDIIFLDINMPLKNGIETLDELRSDIRFYRWPVVMLSTADDPFIMKQLFEKGADHYFVKPDCIEALQQIICKSLVLPLIQRSNSDAAFGYQNIYGGH